MVTYILISTLFQSFVLASRAYEVADEIEDGHIINKMLKPFSFFTFQATHDLADKTINFLCQVIEITVLVICFRPIFQFQTDPQALLVVFLMVILGATIGFYINLMLAFLAFWTTETWAPSFIFTILVSFLAGGYFPLDILPKPIYHLLLLTPFPYLYFLPAKTYVSGLDSFSLIGLAVCGLWALIFYFAARFMWRKGLRSYNFFGQ